MKKILFVSDSMSTPNPTGLAYVASSFMKRLDLSQYEVGYLNITGQDSTADHLIHFGEDFHNKFNGNIKKIGRAHV